MQAVDYGLGYGWLNKSDSEILSAMMNSGDYLPMANIVHLTNWRNTWVWADFMLCLTRRSLHTDHLSLSPDRGTMC